MAEVNLLARYPRAKRNVKARLGNKDVNRAKAMKFVASASNTREGPGLDPLTQYRRYI